MVKGIQNVGPIDRIVLLWLVDLLHGWLVAYLFTSTKADARISH